MSRLPTQRLAAASAALADVAQEVDIYDKATAAELRGYAEALLTTLERLRTTPRLASLTPAQSAVLTFVRQYLETHGESPTRRQIADAFNFSSANAAQTHLKALERKGYLTLPGTGAREIQLTNPNQQRTSQ